MCNEKNAMLFLYGRTCVHVARIRCARRLGACVFDLLPAFFAYLFTSFPFIPYPLILFFDARHVFIPFLCITRATRTGDTFFISLSPSLSSFLSFSFALLIISLFQDTSKYPVDHFVLRTFILKRLLHFKYVNLENNNEQLFTV